MRKNKNIIVFKNLTEGFMNLKYINFLVDTLSVNKELQESYVFVLDNDNSNEKNQALMQMYNSLMGFNIFVCAYSNGELLEFKRLNGLQLRRKVESKKMDLKEFLNDKYKDYNIIVHVVENDLYQNIMRIIKEDLKCQ